MKVDRAQRVVVKNMGLPTVEIDTEASAAYVRFNRGKVARTVRYTSSWPIVTIDLDARGEVVGIEFVGVKRFDLGYLLKRVRLQVTPRAMAGASYVSAEVDLATA